MLLTASISTSTVLRVACVGDSITAGYKATNDSYAYPGRLQHLLDAKFPGKYEVSNLGAGGATLQKNTTSPYWKRDQYAQFVNGTWDVIIVMLGTNDAHEEPNDWPASCSEPNPTADSLVPQVAAEAKLPKPIDVYTALGGTSDWRDDYPFCGCGGGTARAVGVANFTQEHGYPRKGDDFDVANLTYAEAEAECAASDKCTGFTFNASSPKPEERTETYLKRCHDYLKFPTTAGGLG